MPSRVGRGGDGSGTSSLTEVGAARRLRRPRRGGPADAGARSQRPTSGGSGKGRRAGAAGRRGRCRGGDSFAEHARSRRAGKTARATGVPAAPVARGRTGAVAGGRRPGG